MSESLNQNFNHLKIHTQYSICEGAAKLMIYKNILNQIKLNRLGICDTSNLCGALRICRKNFKNQELNQ